MGDIRNVRFSNSLDELRMHAILLRSVSRLRTMNTQSAFPRARCRMSRLSCCDEVSWSSHLSPFPLRAATHFAASLTCLPTFDIRAFESLKGLSASARIDQV